MVPFDAELFGHFWHEGPVFLEAVLRRLGAAGMAATLDEVAGPPGREDGIDRGQPARSTWGEGGHAATWTGPKTAALWRHVHHAGRKVLAAARGAAPRSAAHEEALAQAIVEVLLLQASDFAFMIHRGTTVEYAERRAAEHASRASRLAELATAPALSAAEVAWIAGARDRWPFLRELPADTLRGALLR